MWFFIGIHYWIIVDVMSIRSGMLMKWCAWISQWRSLIRNWNGSWHIWLLFLRRDLSWFRVSITLVEWQEGLIDRLDQFVMHSPRLSHNRHCQTLRSATNSLAIPPFAMLKSNKVKHPQVSNFHQIKPFANRVDRLDGDPVICKPNEIVASFTPSENNWNIEFRARYQVTR